MLLFFSQETFDYPYFQVPWGVIRLCPIQPCPGQRWKTSRLLRGVQHVRYTLEITSLNERGNSHTCSYRLYNSPLLLYLEYAMKKVVLRSAISSIRTTTYSSHISILEMPRREDDDDGSIVKSTAFGSLCVVRNIRAVFMHRALEVYHSIASPLSRYSSPPPRTV